jgi:hypothetical protein
VRACTNTRSPTQVLQRIDDEWVVTGLPSDSDPLIRTWASFNERSTLFSALEIENDNQFNIKVNIKVRHFF